MQTLKIADDLLLPILEGKKEMTIRRGRRDIQLGPLKFETVSGNDDVEVEVFEVRYLKISEVSDDICQEDGFDDWDDFFEGMKKFYPDLKEEEECTIIIFEQ